jgi:hypothetical protein
MNPVLKGMKLLLAFAFAVAVLATTSEGFPGPLHAIIDKHIDNFKKVYPQVPQGPSIFLHDLANFGRTFFLH